MATASMHDSQAANQLQLAVVAHHRHQQQRALRCPHAASHAGIVWLTATRFPPWPPPQVILYTLASLLLPPPPIFYTLASPPRCDHDSPPLPPGVTMTPPHTSLPPGCLMVGLWLPNHGHGKPHGDCGQQHVEQHTHRYSGQGHVLTGG